MGYALPSRCIFHVRFRLFCVCVSPEIGFKGNRVHYWISFDSFSPGHKKQVEGIDNGYFATMAHFPLLPSLARLPEPRELRGAKRRGSKLIKGCSTGPSTNKDKTKISLQN